MQEWAQTSRHEIKEALQKELSERLVNVTFKKGETEENWSEFRDER